MVKPISDYGVDKTTKDGHRYSCKECYNAQQREYAKNNKQLIKDRNAKRSKERKAYYQSSKGIESSRRAHLKRKYSMTLEDYNQLSEDQNHTCAICYTEETSQRNNFLSVDHDHLTGRVRGLLCNTCNRALGLFNDNIELLNNSIKYLEQNEQH